MGKKRIVLIAAAGVLAALTIALFLGKDRPTWQDVPPVTESLQTHAEDVTQWDRVIAYVPLDDRTDNLEDVVYLAEASGYQVVLPEGDVYCTKLDGQTPNTNGTQYGNREALMEWVRQMDAAGCNLFLLSLDQLFSGGLVHSRAMSAGQDLHFSDGTTLSELEAFDTYILPLSEEPNNKIYLFDSVMRLASTVGYQGFGVEEYHALREYGMVARPALEGEALTLENIFAAYPLSADGVTPAEDALADNTYRDVLNQERIQAYLGARMRKLTLTDHVITALKGAEHQNIQLLIGIDDSSNQDNIQYNELHYLEQQLGQGSTLLTELDSIARLLVARISQEAYDYEVKTSVRYIGGRQSTPSSEFDRYTLEEVVNLNMELLHAQRVPEAEAELQVVVMTAADDPDQSAAYLEEVVTLLEQNLEAGIPTIFIEASNNFYGEDLPRLLQERVDFAGLMAFSGKYYQANVTGVGFSMGFSRYLYLRCCPDRSDAADTAHLKQLANSMTLTSYALNTRYPINVYIRDSGYDYNNIIADQRSKQKIYRQLTTLFQKDCDRVESSLIGGTLLTNLNPVEHMRVADVQIQNVSFPWNRTFEISFTIDAALEPAI